MRTRSILFTLSATIASLAVLSWWGTRHEPSQPSTESKTVVDASPSKGTVSPPGALAGESADSLVQSFESPPTLNGRYALRYHMEIEGKDAVGDASAAQMTLRGTLVVTPQNERTKDGTLHRWLAASLQDGQLTLDDTFRNLADFPTENIAETLAAAFVVPLEQNGRVLEVRFGKGQSIAARGTLAAIMQTTQLVREDPNQTQYELSEWSINGPLTTRWVKRNANEYTREWTSIDTIEAGDSQQTLHEVQGEARTLIEGGWISQVQASQRGRAQTSEDKNVTPAYRWTVELERQTGPARLAQLRPAAFESFVPAALDLKLPEEPALSFVDALSKLEAGTTDNKHWQERIAARKLLVRSLVAHPEAAQDAAALYRAKGTRALVKLSLVEALAEAGTPPAQDMLGQLVGDLDLSLPDRTQVTGAIIGVDNPRDSLLDTLAGLAYDSDDKVYASEVAMVLGGSLAFAAAKDAALARGYLTPYLEAAAEVLRQPTGDEPKRFEERSNWLGGLGNLGSPNALPLIDQGLNDPDEEIRAAAAHALRFQDPATVREHMQQLMHEDGSVPVRLGLLHAAHYLGPDSQLNLVERALQYDESESVRLDAAYVIAAWLPSAPGMRLILAHALEKEKSAKVRNTLRNYLEPGRTAPPIQVIPSVNDLIPDDYQEGAQ